MKANSCVYYNNVDGMFSLTPISTSSFLLLRHFPHLLYSLSHILQISLFSIYFHLSPHLSCHLISATPFLSSPPATSPTPYPTTFLYPSPTITHFLHLFLHHFLHHLLPPPHHFHLSSHRIAKRLQNSEPIMDIEDLVVAGNRHRWAG